MKALKFIYAGVKSGKRDHHGNFDGEYYHYGIDINGDYWISKIPHSSKNDICLWDHKSKKRNWKPNGTDGEEVMALTKDEIKKKFDGDEMLRARCHNSAVEYVTKHTGGSIRHAGIRVIDVMEMIHDYKKDARLAIEDAYALGRLHEARKKEKAKKKG